MFLYYYFITLIEVFSKKNILDMPKVDCVSAKGAQDSLAKQANVSNVNCKVCFPIDHLTSRNWKRALRKSKKIFAIIIQLQLLLTLLLMGTKK